MLNQPKPQQQSTGHPAPLYSHLVPHYKDAEDTGPPDHGTESRCSWPREERAFGPPSAPLILAQRKGLPGHDHFCCTQPRGKGFWATFCPAASGPEKGASGSPSLPQLLAQSCPSIINAQNLTRVSEFHLMGLSEDADLQPVLFGLFLSMYLVTVLGNLLIILTVTSDPHLHTPMYFFLSNLPLADISFTSTTVPKMIVDIQTHNTVISYAGCLTQMSFFYAVWMFG
ncbi:Olfactory receptor 18 [Heterocephalus glaber]|uniref:Olfactory receptor 18 n=1 Tax=Heterocephalus glaber TaxID=10181 RepID=G5BDW2_HETGA|nr:Olfactory receptor 18 [Heterocephalus glaber]